MGILPLQFNAGDGVNALGLSGEEVFEISGIANAVAHVATVRDLVVKARRPDGVVREFTVTLRIDTPQEVLYYQHGGILQYVLRQLLSKSTN